ncbi:MAG TPA: HAD-IA family hydrolase [Tepidisphaeraceae bacterium]
MKQLVVFDLGRVLVRICDNWKHACEVAGVPIPPRDMDEPTRARMMALVVESECGRLDQHAMAHAAAPVLGIRPEHFLALSDAYLLGPFAGAGELIDDLHTAGHATACLSNTNASHWRMMTDPANPHGPVLARLGHRFASHLVGARKPDARIYAHVERTTGVAPDLITFFDDVAENIAAAQSRGWTAHLVGKCENPIPAIRARLRSEGLLT